MEGKDKLGKSKTLLTDEEGLKSKKAGGIEHVVEDVQDRHTPGYNKNKKEVKMKEEEEEVRKNTFQNLISLFGEERRRGLLEPPLTEEQQRIVAIDSIRRSIVQTMQVLIEIASLLHPERLEAVLEEFKEETDLNRIIMLDWLDWAYRSYGQVHVLQDMLVKTIRRQAIDVGILGENEQLPELPKTKLGPVLEELAGRITAARR